MTATRLTLLMPPCASHVWPYSNMLSVECTVLCPWTRWQTVLAMDMCICIWYRRPGQRQRGGCHSLVGTLRQR